MKYLIQLASVALMFSIASCSTVEVQQPNENTIVNEVNLEVDFSAGNNSTNHVDINADGVIDFLLIAMRSQIPGHPEFGNVAYIGLEALTPGNEIASGLRMYESFCENLSIDLDPTYAFSQAQTVDQTHANWTVEQVMYIHMVTPAECSQHFKLVEEDKINTIGVKFMNEGHTFYGWVNIMVEDITTQGCPGLPERLVITETGYNPMPNEGAIVK